MDSLLTLSTADYHLVDLSLRIGTALVAAVALLLGLSTMCVEPRRRFPLILGAVALLAAAWFESGISRAWQGAFELAGSSYCVTGLPLAGEERVMVWSMVVPALLFCFGLIGLDRGGGNFRHLCVATLLMVLFGPFVFTAAVLGTLYALSSFRAMALRPAGGTAHSVIISTRIGLASIATSLAMTLMGRMKLLPLGKTADSVLVRGELIGCLGDLLAMALPGAALLACILNLRVEGKSSA